MDGLVRSGVDAHGCDVGRFWPDESPRFLLIKQQPYRIDAADATYDVVVSTSVLEHAQNVAEVQAEIARVLKPGGVALHQYPAKWYLPTEPHIFVPLVSWFWPSVPAWWLRLWALLGIRNERQRGLPWRTVVEQNVAFCDTGLCYVRESAFRAAAAGHFTSVDMPMDYFLRHAGGGAAKIYRKVPNRAFAWLLRKTRTVFVVMRR